MLKSKGKEKGSKVNQKLSSVSQGVYIANMVIFMYQPYFRSSYVLKKGIIQIMFN